MKANQDIRDYMEDHGVSQRRLAEELGVSVWTVNTDLKTELSQAKKDMWLNVIDSIAPKSAGYVAEAVPDEDDCAEEVEAADDDSVSTVFRIGDRVKIPAKADKIGTVTDIWHSVAKTSVMYAVQDEGGHCGLYAENQLEPAPLPIEYTFSAVVENNVAVVCMMARQGEKSWVYSRGHAHILHDGAVGQAQAVSYAARRMFESLDTKQENPIYFKDGGTK